MAWLTEWKDRVMPSPVSKPLRIPCRRRPRVAKTSSYAARQAGSPGGGSSMAIRDAMISCAERELDNLSREIATAEARAGMLRRQRDNLMNWIFRQAASPEWRPDSPPRRHAGLVSLKNDV